MESMQNMESNADGAGIDKESKGKETISLMNAYENAGFFSRLYFLWCFNMVKLSGQREITGKDLGQLPEKDKAQELYNDFKKVWYEQDYKSKSRAVLYSTIKLNWSIYLIYLLIFFVRETIDQVRLLLFTFLIDYFQGIYHYDLSLKQIGFAFLPVELIYSNFSRYSNFYTEMIDKTHIRLKAFLFQKSLKASMSSTTYKAAEGDILDAINSCGNLSWPLTNVLESCINIIFLPIRAYYLYSFFSWSFVPSLLLSFGKMAYDFFFYSKMSEIWEKQQIAVADTTNFITEVYNNIKILKLYCWEKLFEKNLHQKKDEATEAELNNEKLYAKQRIYGSVADVVINIITIGFYQYWNNNTLNVSSMLLGLGLFSTFKWRLVSIVYCYKNFKEMNVTVEKISKICNQEEQDISRVKNTEDSNVAIKITNGTFSWGVLPIKDKKDKDDTEETKSKTEEQLLLSTNELKYQLKDINLEIKKGEKVGIFGEIGSGKSTLINAILNNLLMKDLENASLEVNGTISYVSQSPWIQNKSIRDNILFFNEYEEKRYLNTLKICQLNQDINEIKGGDFSMTGEKGFTLSGGQKARLCLARAVYQESDIYLLDDPISALDNKVAGKIMSECILGHLREKTLILVTHALHFLHNMDRIIFLKDGEIVFNGSFDDFQQNENYLQFISELELKKVTSEVPELFKRQTSIGVELIEKSDEQKKEEEKESKLMEEDDDKGAEEIKTMEIISYLKGIGFISILYILFFELWNFIGDKAHEIWLTIWTEIQTPERNVLYLVIYSFLSCWSLLFSYPRTIFRSKLLSNFSSDLYKKMITSTIDAPVNLFHEKVPRGRIVLRLTRHIQQVSLWSLILLTMNVINLVGTILICTYYQWWCLFLLPLIGYAMTSVKKYTDSSSKQLQKLSDEWETNMANTLSESISGISVIRAFRKEKHFIDSYNNNLDMFDLTSRCTWAIDRFSSSGSSLLRFMFAALVIIYSIFFPQNITAQGIQLILKNIIDIRYLIDDVVDFLKELFKNMFYFNKCNEYATITPELNLDLPLSDELKSQNWPNQGKIEFSNLSLKYRPETDIVLKDISVTFESGQRIGIVGRTGSGKSTLGIALFRIVEPCNGTIKIDNVDITKLGIRALREKLTIIPQEPVLFKGSLRFNLDPTNSKTDAEIEAVLKDLNAWYLCEKDEKGIYMDISNGGENFSLGEKQLLCVIRAVIRNTKVILMDEATANIDLKSEHSIQKAISSSFKNSTLITIAHRIQTIIDYDKILVLDKGEVKEFDSPSELIKNKSSIFYQLYQRSKI